MWNGCRVNNILFLIRFRGARGRKIVTTHTIFGDHKFCQILGAASVRRLHQNALLEPVVLMQNSIFEKTYFFQQKSLKSIFARHGARLGAKSWPSWRRHLSTVPLKISCFFSTYIMNICFITICLGAFVREIQKFGRPLQTYFWEHDSKKISIHGLQSIEVNSS